ncbi:glycosyltransferase family 2 protein [Candidatus Omnitrophota bacterium]
MKKYISYPKISIVTPNYNKGEFLERAMLSVLDQDYPNLEYIIIEDGSTDGSIEVVKKYEKFLTYWESRPNKGQISAINRGFSKATGEIITWLNSDDFYYPGILRKVAEEFLEDPCLDLLYGDAICVSEEGTPFMKATPRGINLRLLSIDTYLPQPSTFFKKELIERKGFLDESFVNLFDYDFFIKVFKSGRSRYLPLLMSGMTISYRDRTFRDWNITVKECSEVQTKHFGSPSLKMHINSAACEHSKYVPHLSEEKITLRISLLGILKYIKHSFYKPIFFLKHSIAVINLCYLRLIRRIWTWNRIGVKTERNCGK